MTMMMISVTNVVLRSIHIQKHVTANTHVFLFIVQTDNQQCAASCMIKYRQANNCSLPQSMTYSITALWG